MSDILSITDGLKEEYALKSLLSNFPFEYTIRKFQGNQDGLKLFGAHQLLNNAYNDNILGESMHNIKKEVDDFYFGIKENGIEVNDNKTKYNFMSWDQNEGRNHSINIDNSSFE